MCLHIDGMLIGNHAPRVLSETIFTGGKKYIYPILWWIRAPRIAPVGGPSAVTVVGHSILIRATMR